MYKSSPSFQHVTVLGSTGSIGKNTLEVLSRFPDEFRVSYLTGNKNIELLEQQVERFHPKGVVVADECSASILKKRLGVKVEILVGEDGLCEIVSRDNTDIVVSSLVGFAGLMPTIRAIESGKKIALANKETLVVAGEIITALAQKNNVRILPIDSEHSAIFQCLVGENSNEIDNLILTASGGPFFHLAMEEIENVTLSEALTHPNWKMGNKITIDSATMMNKGLEVIEAYWLFQISPEKIHILIHPQSIVHSMVEFVDGSVKAQLGIPDMKIAIQYALTYPERRASNYARANFTQLHKLTFFEPDDVKFPCIALAYRALSMGGTATTVLNAANEIAVQLFLEEKIRFVEIPKIIEAILTLHTPILHPTLEQIFITDKETRRQVLSLYEQKYFNN
ncbi:MAG: 1-deoxy-D-xylulose-5-phosphate reductoisomerase [Bacteroidota bacterium]